MAEIFDTSESLSDRIEIHPFTPFIPKGTKMIMCGTFPPKPEKWAMDFFYPNFYNDMWRIFGQIFYNDKDKFFDKVHKLIDKEGIQAMLTAFHVGIGETVIQAIRQKNNASDKFLEVVKTVDLPELLGKIPECSDFVTTGEKAASIIAGLTSTELPKIGEYIECECEIKSGVIRKFRHWRMPSTSRAYPMKLEVKTQYYKTMMQTIGII